VFVVGVEVAVVVENEAKEVGALVGVIVEKEVETEVVGIDAVRIQVEVVV
jgi:hypothetical protein